MKLLTIIGARPQIIKAAALSRAIRTDYSDRIQEVILHTGQHYDNNMSQVFFDEMGIPGEDYNLNVGSGPHGKQTAAMMEGIEKVINKEKPDFLVIYGDTNSTLAGAVAAVKMGVPVAHIEAGLRSSCSREYHTYVRYILSFRLREQVGIVRPRRCPPDADGPRPGGARSVHGATTVAG